jgi:serine/threonine protein kinase
MRTVFSLDRARGIDRTLCVSRLTDPEPARAPDCPPSSSVREPKVAEDNSTDQKPASSKPPITLGGYQVLKVLGKGGMGAVLLARQLSLDRHVALKIMKPEWAKDPTFLARFTREAFAAAQLVHHNVVQIHDIGAHKGIHYFSMEYVQGQTLKQLVKEQGKLDPEAAVGFVLQAARGLKFAHEQGMIHRDVKPDNLMLNDQGIIKVADLGLVKTPSSAELTLKGQKCPQRTPLFASPHSDVQVTDPNAAMGTPAFMAPEQARDASHVDARADIYSLGCTLYVMVTGRTPFDGETALEVMTKHALEPVVPPDVIVKRVPKELSVIIMKMVAKKPEDRYASMDELIQALEQFLGVQSAGPFSPREEHAEILEDCVKRFNEAPLAWRRARVIPGFFAGCAALVVLFFLLRAPVLVGSFAGLSLMTTLCHFLIHGYTRKTQLFLKARELVLSSRWSDWLVWLGGTLLVVLLLHLFNLLGLWLAMCLLAGLLTGGMHFFIDRPLAAQRRLPIEKSEKMLRDLRLRGLEEEAIRQFVCKYSGPRWEEFYEALFGYEAKLAARARWGGSEWGKGREKFAAWRDPILSWMEAKQRARQDARAKKLLQTVEEEDLRAKGVDGSAARQQAERAATAMVEQAADIKDSASPTSANRLMRKRPQRSTRSNVRSLLEVADNPDIEVVVRERRSLDFLSGPLRLLLGPKVRFLAGVVLLAGCLMWMNQNNLVPGKEIKEATTTAIQQGQADPEAARQIATSWLGRLGEARPLQLALIPGDVTDWVGNLNAGLAGLILLLSSLTRGLRMGIVYTVAAAITLAGHQLGIPALGPLAAQYVSMVGGLGLAILGFVLTRSDS